MAKSTKLLCKRCTWVLDVTPDIRETVCWCEHCNTKQPIPRLFERKRGTVKKMLPWKYERKKKIFDSGLLILSWEQPNYAAAARVYEDALQDFPGEPEAYWGLCRCRYGVQYVKSDEGDRVLVCRKTVGESIFDDENYRRVMEFADEDARVLYQEEAEEIEQIQTKLEEERAHGSGGKAGKI